MSLEYQKRQYEERMNLIEAKYKKIAEIFHAKGRKAFNDAIYKQKLPNWNEFFEDEWVKFTTQKAEEKRISIIEKDEIDELVKKTKEEYEQGLK